MIANDITDYYLENSQPTLTASSTASLSLPVIESWISIDVSNKVVIRGRIFNHPKYPAGKQIKSSPIQRVLTKAGRVYVTTKNSMYELGLPHQDFAGDIQRLIANTENQPIEKMTYWGE